MKLTTLLFVLLALSVAAFGQNVQNLYAGGLSYGVGSSPALAGTGLYARLVADGSGTYAFGVIDALPATVHPFTVNTNVGTGIAQKIFSSGKVSFYVPTGAGISWNGSNTGWQWSTGGAAAIPLKGSWMVLPTVRVVKSSVSGGSGYQPIVGILVGWGK